MLVGTLDMLAVTTGSGPRPQPALKEKIGNSVLFCTVKDIGGWAHSRLVYRHGDRGTVLQAGHFGIRQRRTEDSQQDG